MAQISGVSGGRSRTHFTSVADYTLELRGSSPARRTTATWVWTEDRLGCACPGRRDRAQPVQRLALDLATAFLADSQAAADFFVGLDLVLIQAVPADHDVAMSDREKSQHRGHLALVLMRDCALARILGALVDNEIGERRQAIADRLIQ